MTWAKRCPERVSQALESIKGVEKAKTDYATKKSTVKAKGAACGFQGEEKMILAVKKEGYTATILSNRRRR